MKFVKFKCVEKSQSHILPREATASAVQSKKIVTVHFKNEQSLPAGIASQSSFPRFFVNPDITASVLALWPDRQNSGS